MDSCFDLVGSRQHGVASYEIFSLSTDVHILTKMVMTTDETQIQILVNWPMSNAKRVTRDNWKNPELISCRCRDKVTVPRTTWVRSPLGSCLGDMAVRMPDCGLVFERVTCFYCLKRVTFLVDCVKCLSIPIIKTG